MNENGGAPKKATSDDDWKQYVAGTLRGLEIAVSQTLPLGDAVVLRLVLEHLESQSPVTVHDQATVECLRRIIADAPKPSDSS